MAPANSTRATTTTSQSKMKSLRRGQEEKCLANSKFQQQRPASFHSRGTELCGHVRQPKTHRDLLERRRRGASSGEGVCGRVIDGSIYSEAMRRVPAKVLVNVTVLRSPGPVQVMASMEWSVADLVAAAMQLYVKEGRQPPPPTTAPSAFSLHYSQFSLERMPCSLNSNVANIPTQYNK